MTIQRQKTSRLGAVLAALALSLAAAAPVSAQNLFDPAIKVGDSVVTNYEMEQRALMLRLLNAPGIPEEEARDQLIEDRLKLKEAARLGITIDDEVLAAGKLEFAQRANLSTEDFVAALGQAGVAEQTFDDFVRSGLAWRQVVRGRFGRFVNITDQDVAMALTTAPNPESVRLLISEIFIPLRPGQEGEAQALAEQISQIQGLDGFSDAARRFSAAPSAQAGGRVNWLPVTEVPPNLRAVLLDLEPGEVSAPIAIPNALAIFQLRAIDEGPYTARAVTEYDYAIYHIAGGRTPEALQRAAELRAEIDQCDDLYTTAKGQPPQVLERQTVPVGQVPQDIAYELAKLDKNEVSTALTRGNGQTLAFLMLCDRVTEAAKNADAAQVRTQLQNEELDHYATGLLERLRNETRIVIY